MPEPLNDISVLKPEEQFKKSEGFSSFYSNNIKIEHGAWDLMLIFGELTRYVIGDEPVQIKDHAHITVPWLQAKALAIFLSVNIAAHEEVNGSIRVPDSLFNDPLKSILTNRDAPLYEIFEAILAHRAKLLT